MRVPLSWLRDYVDVELDPEQLAERLTLLGMEVKGIERWGADWRNVVVGELLEVDAPSARRPALADPRRGSGDEVLEIVCGATNIAAGQRVPVALPGRRPARQPASSSGPRRWASSATGCSAPATSCA